MKKLFSILMMDLHLKLLNRNAVYTRRITRIIFLSKLNWWRRTKYLVERERLQALVGISGSAYDGSLLVRSETGAIRLFEDPYTGEIYDDETTTLFVSRKVDQLKDDDSINDIIDRNITEL